ncbi:MAG: RES domain-containing protein [Candidatus Rokuibacteriota bacterium]
MIAFRHGDPRYPFFWEDGAQPAARWHAAGEGPVQYLCDTPDGAWAEFLRHEEIRTPEDLVTVRRALWAIDVGDEPRASAELPREILGGGPETYRACQAEARRLRAGGATGFVAPAAALLPGGARGWRTDGGLQPADSRDGRVIVLFGRRPELVGWAATAAGRPRDDVLAKTRYL